MTKIADPDPDPLVRGMDPRIRIHPKMSWIRNTSEEADLCVEGSCSRLRTQELNQHRRLLLIKAHLLTTKKKMFVAPAGGYKERSSIFADQLRPSNTSPNAGGEMELRGLSHWEQLCTSRDMEPKKTLEIYLHI